MPQEILHLAFELGITEHRKVDLDHAPLPRLARCASAFARMTGVGRLIGNHEGLALLRSQVADPEDGLEMARRHRDRIDGIGDLGDEAAVLADGLGDFEPEPGGAAVDIFLQQALIGSDQLVAPGGRSR